MPRCPSCGWTLRFSNAYGHWIGRCWNKACVRFGVIRADEWASANLQRVADEIREEFGFDRQP